MADDADVMEIERMGPGPTERADIAAMLDAIGGAANATLLDSSLSADDAVGQQMRRDLARLGSLIILRLHDQGAGGGPRREPGSDPPVRTRPSGAPRQDLSRS